MVIKRNEGDTIPDAPIFRGSGPSAGNRGPSIPVYIDIPLVTPGGGRADAPNTGIGGLDIYDRGNNPYQVSQRAQRVIREQAKIEQRSKIVAAEVAAKARSDAAQRVRSRPVCCA